MRHVLSLAAFAAVSMNSAQADDGVPAVRPDAPCTGDGCPGHKPKAPAPVPAPAPAEPEPEVVPPAPAPAEPAPVAPVQGDIEVVLPPPAEPEHHGNDRFRIGGSLGLRGDMWAIPAQIIDNGSHDALPAAELNPGAYIGYQSSTDPGAIYVGLNAQYGRGSIASASWSGSLMAGAVATPNVILGISAGGTVRDYGVSEGQYNARFMGGGGGLVAIVDLAPKTKLLDASLVPDVHLNLGSVRNPVTSEVMPLVTDFGVGVALRLGIHSN